MGPRPVKRGPRGDVTHGLELVKPPGGSAVQPGGQARGAASTPQTALGSGGEGWSQCRAETVYVDQLLGDRQVEPTLSPRGQTGLRGAEASPRWEHAGRLQREPPREAVPSASEERDAHRRALPGSAGGVSVESRPARPPGASPPGTAPRRDANERHAAEATGVASESSRHTRRLPSRQQTLRAPAPRPSDDATQEPGVAGCRGDSLPAGENQRGVWGTPQHGHDGRETLGSSVRSLDKPDD